MKTFVQKGDKYSLVESALTHPSHSDNLVDSGDPVVIGRLVGVAATSASASTDLISIELEGVHDLSVTTIHNGITAGETVYISSSAILSDDYTGTPFGTAMEAITLVTATDTINVRLFGATPGAAGANS